MTYRPRTALNPTAQAMSRANAALLQAINATRQPPSIHQATTAAQAYQAQVEELASLLNDLRRLANAADAAPDSQRTWGDACSLAGWNAKLRQVTDAAFHRGEFAE